MQVLFAVVKQVTCNASRRIAQAVITLLFEMHNYIYIQLFAKLPPKRSCQDDAQTTPNSVTMLLCFTFVTLFSYLTHSSAQLICSIKPLYTVWSCTWSSACSMALPRRLGGSMLLAADSSRSRLTNVAQRCDS